MVAVSEVQLDIVDRQGRVRGKLTISLLPSQQETSPSPLLDLRRTVQRDMTQEPVQLLEGQEYRYTIELADQVAQEITTDREEIFIRDTQRGDTGRLRTGLYTGTLEATIKADGQPVGKVALEVRSRKLDYMQHYRWMLRDIAEQFTEVLMRSFAPTQQRFTVSKTKDAATLYQRFAFLKSLITDDSLESAIAQILTNPDRQWTNKPEMRRPGQGIPAKSGVLRQLTRPGRRVPVQNAAAGLQSLPAAVMVERTEETLDTLPNRFIKFVLMRWRDMVASIHHALTLQMDTAQVKRGIDETRVVLGQLDRWLAEPFFHEVGVLTQFPSGNQVLQKQEGYRDVMLAYLQSELAAALSWSGGSEVYSAGQRDVAALYEYWVFLQLAAIISALIDREFDLASLLETTPDGLNITLRRGHQQVLSGTTERLGRILRVELWYNRTFSASGTAAESWTRKMRPDYSIRIYTDGYGGTGSNDIWLHFDAKYRIETLLGLFGDEGETDDDFEPGADDMAIACSRARRPDLLKMHAYRDAIRRSSGAYVIYPGTGVPAEVKRQYHEILPGLGAFALMPSASGGADGAGVVAAFIDDVLKHVASQVTQHERERFWVREIYEDAPIETPAYAASFLTRPPADTLVLLGFVRSRAHHEWIKKTGMYNLRADRRTGSVGLGSRELAVDLVILYGPGIQEPELWQVAGQPQLMSRAQMRAARYPGPGGKLYYCLPLQKITREQWPVTMSTKSVLALRSEKAPQARYGAPVVCSWLDIIRVIAWEGERVRSRI